MRNAPSNSEKTSAITRLTAIFGDPVEHSQSPSMHNAAYAALGIDRRYVAFQVAPAQLAAALRAIPALGIAGVNLTVPHKERALQAMDEVSAEGRLLGAINCVINRRGRLIGDNTDARGLEQDLRMLKVKIAGRAVLVIGAGGAAASAALAMIRLKAARVVIANRTRARALRLAQRLSRTFAHPTRLEAAGLDALTDSTLLGNVACVVNATSMGLTTRDFARLDYTATPRTCFFYDLLYARKATAFLSGAIRIDRKHADGSGMLVEQAELAFKLFNGVAPPKGVMRRALTAALGRE
ncbi:MAG TPA: shikimate dehydrogenase [Candidatus Binataceae bacterium]|nr:shikimate dehydrogenase [Candidatus Binataceae bacterium]